MNTIDGKQALQRLMEGNKRYVAGNLVVHPHQTRERRVELTAGQHPFAIMLSCSDSRVPPEIIFDQGLGDLFVIRVAGNVIDDVIVGSIEYAVEHLGVQLLMVLGHEQCGAVTAAVKGGEAHGHIHRIVEAIEPAVAQARHLQGDLVDNTVKTHVALLVEHLKTSQPILANLVQEDKLTIVGAYYHLESGLVTALKVTKRD
jgi:carbonic anhydrase